MSLSITLAFKGNLTEYSRQTHLRFAAGARNAAEKQAARAKLWLRSDTRRALGDRVANAWRADVYPASASVRTHSPAVFVYSKAEKIVLAFAESTVIRAKNTAFLAIPTDNTPRRQGRLATPVEVEAIFNQDLIFIHGRGQQMLAFVDVVKSRNGKGFRRATKGRLSKGRRPELVLMFVMVRQVGLQKRLNWQRIYGDLEASWAELWPAEISAALSAGSN